MNTLYFTMKIAQQQWRGNVKENQISTLLRKKTPQQKKERKREWKGKNEMNIFITTKHHNNKEGKNERGKWNEQNRNPKRISKRERDREREKERERNGIKASSKGKVKSLFSH